MSPLLTQRVSTVLRFRLISKVQAFEYVYSISEAHEESTDFAL